MSVWGKGDSKIGVGHDGKPTLAKPGEPHEHVHHVPAGSTNSKYAAPHVGKPKAHLAIPVHAAFADQIKPDGDGLTGRGHATASINDGGTVVDNTNTVHPFAKAPPESFKQGRLSPVMPGMRNRSDDGGVEGIHARLPGSPGFEDCGE